MSGATGGQPLSLNNFKTMPLIQKSHQEKENLTYLAVFLPASKVCAQAAATHTPG